MRFPKRIVVAVDFSDPSLAALEYGIRLFQRNGSTLVAVHVMEPRRAMRLSPRGPQRIGLLRRDGGSARRAAGARLRHAAERLGLAVGPATRLLVCSGEPGDIVCSAALEANASLILVGRTGRGGAADIGRLTRRLMAIAPCPVIPVWDEARGAMSHVTRWPA